MSNTRRRPWGILVLLALIAAFALPKLLPRGGETEVVADPAPGEPAPLEVEVVELAPRRLAQSLTTTGTLSANQSVELVTEIAGKIERILFAEGSRVDRDELLVKIDGVQLQAERERVFYRLDLARQREVRQRELLQLGLTAQQEMTSRPASSPSSRRSSSWSRRGSRRPRSGRRSRARSACAR